MLFRKRFFVLSLLCLLLAGCNLFGGRVFAVNVDLSKFDNAINELRKQQKETPGDGRDYGKMIEYVELKKQVARLENEIENKMNGLSECDRRLVDERCNSFDLVSWDPFCLFDKFEKSVFGDDFFGIRDSMKRNLQLFSDKVNCSVPSAVRDLQKSKKPGFVVIDGKNNVKFKKMFGKSNNSLLDKFKSESKEIGFKDAFNNLLVNYVSDGLDSLVKGTGGYKVAVNLGAKEDGNKFIWFGDSADGSAFGSFYSSFDRFSSNLDDKKLVN